MAIYSIANVDVGTYLTVVLVLIVFSEYLPLFEYCFFGYCFPVKFARERIQFLRDHLKDLFLSSSVCVCVRMCMDNNAIYICIYIYVYIYIFPNKKTYATKLAIRSMDQCKGTHPISPS